MRRRNQIANQQVNCIKTVVFHHYRACHTCIARGFQLEEHEKCNACSLLEERPVLRRHWCSSIPVSFSVKDQKPPRFFKSLAQQIASSSHPSCLPVHLKLALFHTDRSNGHDGTAFGLVWVNQHIDRLSQFDRHSCRDKAAESVLGLCPGVCPLGDDRLRAPLA